MYTRIRKNVIQNKVEHILNKKINFQTENLTNANIINLKTQSVQSSR